jgi:hypothetical protein
MRTRENPEFISTRARLMSDAAVDPTSSTGMASSLVASDFWRTDHTVLTSDVAALSTRRPMSFVSCRTAPTYASPDRNAE